MFRIRKVFKFEGAHILDNSYSKDCQKIHGHSYTVEVFCKSDHLNEYMMVEDFGKIKDIVKPLIDKWDHALIVSENKIHDFPMYEIRVFEGNPTAEAMALYLYKTLKFSISSLYKVRIHETSTGWAEYEGES